MPDAAACLQLHDVKIALTEPTAPLHVIPLSRKVHVTLLVQGSGGALLDSAQRQAAKSCSRAPGSCSSGGGLQLP